MAACPPPDEEFDETLSSPERQSPTDVTENENQNIIGEGTSADNTTSSSALPTDNVQPRIIWSDHGVPNAMAINQQTSSNNVWICSKNTRGAKLFSATVSIKKAWRLTAITGRRYIHVTSSGVEVHSTGNIFQKKRWFSSSIRGPKIVTSFGNSDAGSSSTDKKSSTRKKSSTKSDGGSYHSNDEIDTKHKASVDVHMLHSFSSLLGGIATPGSRAADTWALNSTELAARSLQSTGVPAVGGNVIQHTGAELATSSISSSGLEFSFPWWMIMRVEGPNSSSQSSRKITNESYDVSLVCAPPEYLSVLMDQKARLASLLEASAMQQLQSLGDNSSACQEVLKSFVECVAESLTVMWAASAASTVVANQKVRGQAAFFETRHLDAVIAGTSSFPPSFPRPNILKRRATFTFSSFAEALAFRESFERQRERRLIGPFMCCGLPMKDWISQLSEIFQHPSSSCLTSLGMPIVHVIQRQVPDRFNALEICEDPIAASFMHEINCINTSSSGQSCIDTLLSCNVMRPIHLRVSNCDLWQEPRRCSSHPIVSTLPLLDIEAVFVFDNAPEILALVVADNSDSRASNTAICAARRRMLRELHAHGHGSTERSFQNILCGAKIKLYVMENSALSFAELLMNRIRTTFDVTFGTIRLGSLGDLCQNLANPQLLLSLNHNIQRDTASDDNCGNDSLRWCLALAEQICLADQSTFATHISSIPMRTACAMQVSCLMFSSLHNTRTRRRASSIEQSASQPDSSMYASFEALRAEDLETDYPLIQWTNQFKDIFSKENIDLNRHNKLDIDLGFGVLRDWKPFTVAEFDAVVTVDVQSDDTNTAYSTEIHSFVEHHRRRARPIVEDVFVPFLELPNSTNNRTDSSNDRQTHCVAVKVIITNTHILQQIQVQPNVFAIFSATPILAIMCTGTEHYPVNLNSGSGVLAMEDESQASTSIVTLQCKTNDGAFHDPGRTSSLDARLDPLTNSQALKSGVASQYFDALARCYCRTAPAPDFIFDICFRDGILVPQFTKGTSLLSVTSYAKRSDVPQTPERSVSAAKISNIFVQLISSTAKRLGQLSSLNLCETMPLVAKPEVRACIPISRHVVSDTAETALQQPENRVDIKELPIKPLHEVLTYFTQRQLDISTDCDTLVSYIAASVSQIQRDAHRIGIRVLSGMVFEQSDIAAPSIFHNPEVSSFAAHMCGNSSPDASARLPLGPLTWSSGRIPSRNSFEVSGFDVKPSLLAEQFSRIDELSNGAIFESFHDTCAFDFSTAYPTSSYHPKAYATPLSSRIVIGNPIPEPMQTVNYLIVDPVENFVTQLCTMGIVTPLSRGYTFRRNQNSMNARSSHSGSARSPNPRSISTRKLSADDVKPNIAIDEHDKTKFDILHAKLTPFANMCIRVYRSRAIHSGISEAVNICTQTLSRWRECIPSGDSLMNCLNATLYVLRDCNDISKEQHELADASALFRSLIDMIGLATSRVRRAEHAKQTIKTNSHISDCILLHQSPLFASKSDITKISSGGTVIVEAEILAALQSAAKRSEPAIDSWDIVFFTGMPLLAVTDMVKTIIHIIEILSFPKRHFDLLAKSVWEYIRSDSSWLVWLRNFRFDDVDEASNVQGAIFMHAIESLQTSWLQLIWLSCTMRCTSKTSAKLVAAIAQQQISGQTSRRGSQVAVEPPRDPARVERDYKIGNNTNEHFDKSLKSRTFFGGHGTPSKHEAAARNILLQSQHPERGLAGNLATSLAHYLCVHVPYTRLHSMKHATRSISITPRSSVQSSILWRIVVDLFCTGSAATPSEVIYYFFDRCLDIVACTSNSEVTEFSNENYSVRLLTIWEKIQTVALCRLQTWLISDELEHILEFSVAIILHAEHRTVTTTDWFDTRTDLDKTLVKIAKMFCESGLFHAILRLVIAPGAHIQGHSAAQGAALRLLRIFARLYAPFSWMLYRMLPSHICASPCISTVVNENNHVENMRWWCPKGLHEGRMRVHDYGDTGQLKLQMATSHGKQVSSTCWHATVDSRLHTMHIMDSHGAMRECPTACTGKTGSVALLPEHTISGMLESIPYSPDVANILFSGGNTKTDNINPIMLNDEAGANAVIDWFGSPRNVLLSYRPLLGQHWNGHSFRRLWEFLCWRCIAPVSFEEMMSDQVAFMDEGFNKSLCNRVCVAGVDISAVLNYICRAKSKDPALTCYLGSITSNGHGDDECILSTVCKNLHYVSSWAWLALKRSSMLSNTAVQDSFIYEHEVGVRRILLRLCGSYSQSMSQPHCAALTLKRYVISDDILSMLSTTFDCKRLENSTYIKTRSFLRIHIADPTDDPLTNDTSARHQHNRSILYPAIAISGDFNECMRETIAKSWGRLDYALADLTYGRDAIIRLNLLAVGIQQAQKVKSNPVKDISVSILSTNQIPISRHTDSDGILPQGLLCLPMVQTLWESFTQTSEFSHVEAQLNLLTNRDWIMLLHRAAEAVQLNAAKLSSTITAAEKHARDFAASNVSNSGESHVQPLFRKGVPSSLRISIHELCFSLSSRFVELTEMLNTITAQMNSVVDCSNWFIQGGIKELRYVLPTFFVVIAADPFTFSPLPRKRASMTSPEQLDPHMMSNNQGIDHLYHNLRQLTYLSLNAVSCAIAPVLRIVSCSDIPNTLKRRVLFQIFSDSSFVQSLVAIAVASARICAQSEGYILRHETHPVKQEVQLRVLASISKDVHSSIATIILYAISLANLDPKHMCSVSNVSACTLHTKGETNDFSFCTHTCYGLFDALYAQAPLLLAAVCSIHGYEATERRGIRRNIQRLLGMAEFDMSAIDSDNGVKEALLPKSFATINMPLSSIQWGLIGACFAGITHFQLHQTTSNINLENCQASRWDDLFTMKPIWYPILSASQVEKFLSEAASTVAHECLIGYDTLSQTKLSSPITTPTITSPTMDRGQLSVSTGSTGVNSTSHSRAQRVAYMNTVAKDVTKSPSAAAQTVDGPRKQDTVPRSESPATSTNPFAFSNFTKHLWHDDAEDSPTASAPESPREDILVEIDEHTPRSRIQSHSSLSSVSTWQGSSPDNKDIEHEANIWCTQDVVEISTSQMLEGSMLNPMEHENREVNNEIPDTHSTNEEQQVYSQNAIDENNDSQNVAGGNNNSQNAVDENNDFLIHGENNDDTLTSSSHGISHTDGDGVDFVENKLTNQDGMTSCSQNGLEANNVEQDRSITTDCQSSQEPTKSLTEISSETCDQIQGSNLDCCEANNTVAHTACCTTTNHDTHSSATICPNDNAVNDSKPAIEEEAVATVEEEIGVEEKATEAEISSESEETAKYTSSSNEKQQIEKSKITMDVDETKPSTSSTEPIVNDTNNGNKTSNVSSSTNEGTKNENKTSNESTSTVNDTHNETTSETVQEMNQRDLDINPSDTSNGFSQQQQSEVCTQPSVTHEEQPEAKKTHVNQNASSGERKKRSKKKRRKGKH